MSKEFKTFRFASFSSVSDYNIKQFKKSNSSNGNSKSWNTIHPGLSICGKFKNTDCIAYNQTVWKTLGFGTFHMAQWVRKAPCTLCKKPMKKVQRAIIYKANLTGIGQKAKEGDQTDSSDDEAEETAFQYSIMEEDKYFEFGNLQKEIISWNYLILKTTVKKKRCPTNHELKNFKPVGLNWICNECEKQFLRQIKLLVAEDVITMLALIAFDLDYLQNLNLKRLSKSFVF